MTWQEQYDSGMQARKSLDSTEAFANRYAHELWKEDVPFEYLDWYKQVDRIKSSYKLILVHPGAGKSTRLKWEALRRLTEDRNYKIAYISKASKKAGLFMNSIADELKRNKLLIKEHGEFYERGMVWNTETIKIKGSGATPTPSISNYGVTTQIEGMRPNMIIIDDPIDIHTVLSPAECYSIEHIFPTWLQRLDIITDSEMWIIGHRFSPVDLYAHIEENYKNFDVLVLRAWNEDNNELLTPELWDWEKFEEKVLTACRNYEVQTHYQQRYVPLDDSDLSWDWFEKPGQTIPDKDIPTDTEIICCCDLAFSIERKADFSSGAAGMKYKDGVLITALGHWKISAGWEAKFTAFADSAQASKLFIETNNAQAFPVTMKKYAREHGISTKIECFHSTENKQWRLGDLKVPAENGKIYIAESVMGTQAQREFKVQWEMFPNIAHDDMLDAIHMMWTRVKKGRYGISGFDRKELFG